MANGFSLGDRLVINDTRNSGCNLQEAKGLLNSPVPRKKTKTTKKETDQNSLDKDRSCSVSDSIWLADIHTAEDVERRPGRHHLCVLISQLKEI